MQATATTASASGSTGLSRTERQYRTALRHSRRVRILKVALPAASAVFVAGFFAASWIGSSLPDGVSIESAAIEDGKVIMRNPVMTGQNADLQPYTMKAVRAVQDLKTPDVIELQEITADVPVSGDMTAKITANRGVYDRGRQTMVLDQPFKVETSEGMTADLKSAQIDMGGGTVTTTEPVTIRNAQSSVVAKSMQILDKGRSIVFENEVRMVIEPGAMDRKPGTIKPGTGN